MRAGLPLVVLLVSSGSTLGCVSLTKPKNVQECENLPGGCVNNPTRPDASIGPDTAPPPDLPSDPEAAKADAGPDTAQPPPDAALDKADTASPDVAPDNRHSDPVPVSETGATPDVKTDLPADKTTGPEPAREPGVEPRPEPGPEPGKEPGAEPGPEPGREPGREPGPEPGPEPPRDGGVVTNCTIFVGSSGSEGHPPPPGNNNAFCIATCDTIAGWGCSNFEGRTVSVNGAAATSVCGGALTKVNGYNVFKVSAGSRPEATIYWWGTYTTSCPAPDGGLF
jgi:hypothetical protein